MAGKSRPLHELIPICRNSKAYVYRTKWHYLGKWEGDSPSAEAVERLAQLKALWEFDPGAKAKVSNAVLLISLWRAWEASPECPTKNSRDDFARVERYLFGDDKFKGPHKETHLKDFGARELRAWQTCLCGLRTPQGNLLLSRHTISQCIKYVRKCFAWGVIEGKVDQLHAASLLLVEPPAKGKVKEKQKRQSVSRAISDKMALHLSPPLRTAIELLWLTTARPSEVLGLQVEDIKRNGSILLRSGASLDLVKEKVWAAILDKHKTADKGFERVLFFGPRSQAVLSPYLNRNGYLFKPSEGRSFQLAELARILTTTGKGSKKTKKGKDGKRQPGEFYCSHALAKAVSNACMRANVPHFAPYSIRHSAGAAVRDTYGKDAAIVFMGHKPRDVTDGYVGSDLKLAARVAREVC